jgi:hypothetical protein
MPSYIVKKQITIRRQMGDTGDIVFNVPIILPITSREVSFTVKDSRGYLVFDKNTQNGSILKSAQTIAIALVVADTLNHSGSHHWELKLTAPSEVITIGKGIFDILK